jgi:hypothetical protein
MELAFTATAASRGCYDRARWPIRIAASADADTGTLSTARRRRR